MIPIKKDLKRAEGETNTNPTEGQKIAGNYKKGKFSIKGFNISIENPVGSTRSGKSIRGKEWSIKTPFSYGYFRGTVGKDGDPIDVYIGPLIDKDFDVYIIDQVDEETRSFDEHKVMFGFKDEQSAHEAYLSCFEDTWTGFNSITAMSLKKFTGWIKNADAIKYPASRLSMSKKMIFRNSVNPRMKTIQLNGEVLDEEIKDGKIVHPGSLKDLQTQTGNLDNFDTLILEIASPGGSVSEGLMIMVWLDQLSQQGKEIITVVTANAYSIASLIMLAADHKMISKHGEVMVHNPMVPELKYANADELEKYAKELRDLEAIMYELYEIFTGLKTEEIKTLMDNETYLSPEDSIKYGFADLVIDIEPKQFEMVATNSKKETSMLKTLNILNRVIGMVKKADFVNQLYYDQEGGEIEIFQTDPSTYAVGDRTNIEDGEAVLSDGSKLTVEDYIITKIDKSIDVEAVPLEEAPIEEVTPKEVTLEAVVEEPATPVVEEPAVPVVEEPAVPTKSKSEMPGKVIEKTESVISTKETIAKVEEEKVEPAGVLSSVNGEFNEGSPPEKVAKVEGDEVEKPEAKTSEEKPMAEEPKEGAPIRELTAGPKEDALEILVVLKEGMEILTEQVKQLNEDNTEIKTAMSNMAKFEEVATEAIDALASANTSSFKPEAKAGLESLPSGSIFQNMLKKRGLKK